MFESAFYEVSLLLFIAAVLGFVGLKFRQPLLVSFIMVGILTGPSGFGITAPSEHMELLATLGISLLLFIVGLKLDLNLIRTTGKVALMTGLGQVLFTSVFGYGICLLMGMPPLTSLYVAIALTFSSTIIIVKLLSDKGELEALHGRIALGFLIVQDLVVVLLMIGLSASGLFGEEANIWQALGEVAVKGILFLAGVAVFMRFLAERLLRQLARVPEIMMVFVVSWAVILAAATDLLGFSMELGALMAGVSLASTSYRDILATRLTSLRDFLLLFFFINLGAHIDLNGLDRQVLNAVILSLFVLIGNPLIVLIIMGAMGYTRRTSFLAGLTVAQISEFSLVFVALGLSLQHISTETVNLVTLVGLITIALSTYMILYSHRLYEMLGPFLSMFEKKAANREQENVTISSIKPTDVILIGLGRYGRQIAEHLNEAGLTVFGVDHDPEVVHHARHLPCTVHYGDISDPSLISLLPLKEAQCLVVTIPTSQSFLIEADPHRSLVQSLQESHYSDKIVLTVRSDTDIKRFRDVEADDVLHPYNDAAVTASQRIIDLMLTR